MNVYPLLFDPIFKPKIWGGRRLESLLNKRLPENELIGESWEIADLEDDQSVVANGPARGRPLGELVREWETELIGRAPLFEGRFPLLIKFLDANDTLSVQVHPDEATARRLGGRVRVKNEAWYVLHADKDGFIYRGVREGVDADGLKQAIQEQHIETVLNRINARKGHCYYLPSGTIHALGAGVTVAEVQTPSDVTYRVYDWNRIDAATGRPRDLHLQEALECISYETAPIAEETPQHVATVWTAITSLVRSESFVIERVHMTEGMDQPIPHAEFVIWIVLAGRGSIVSDSPASPVEFGIGSTVLIPAGLKDGRIRTHDDCVLLEVTIPVRSALSKFERHDRTCLATPNANDGGSAPSHGPQESTSS